MKKKTQNIFIFFFLILFFFSIFLLFHLSNINNKNSLNISLNINKKLNLDLIDFLVNSGLKTYYQSSVKTNLTNICVKEVEKFEVIEYSALNIDIIINDKNKNKVNNCEELVFEFVEQINLKFYDIVYIRIKTKLFTIYDKAISPEEIKIENELLLNLIKDFINQKEPFLLVKKLNINRHNLKSNTFRLDNFQTHESIIGMLILIQTILIFFLIRSNIKKNKIVNKFLNYLK